LDDFKPTTLPNDEYDEHLHQNLPDLDEIWYDRDLMLAFREYLNQQLANESLSFYMDAVYIENFLYKMMTWRIKLKKFMTNILEESPKLI